MQNTEAASRASVDDLLARIIPYLDDYMTKLVSRETRKMLQLQEKLGPAMHLLRGAQAAKWRWPGRSEPPSRGEPPVREYKEL